MRFRGSRRAEVDLEGMRYLVQLDGQGNVRAATIIAYGIRVTATTWAGSRKWGWYA